MQLTGCANTDNAEESGVVQSAQAVLAQNTSCALGVECTITALYPSGIPSGKTAVVASEGVSIGSRALVRGIDGQFGYVASTTGSVQLQALAKVGGIWTKGSAFVGSQAVVVDKLLANGTVEVQAGAIVGSRGTAVGDPAKANFKVTFPTSQGQDWQVINGATATLPPGRYGTLHVYGGSTVRLKTGVYYFEQVLLEPTAKAIVDTSAGTAVVWVRGELTNRGNWTSTGSPSDVLVGSFYKGRIDLGPEFDATLIASSASVVLGSGNSPTTAHNGLYFARTVEVQGGALVTAISPSKQGTAYAGLSTTWVPATGVTAPTPPSPTGLTYKEYRQQVEAYVTQLQTSGYTGAPVVVAAHPDATKVTAPADFKMPTGIDNPHSVPLTIEPARTITPRTGVQVGVPLTNQTKTAEASSTNGEKITDPSRLTYLDSPHLTDGFNDIKAAEVIAEANTLRVLPFTAQGVPETGVGAGPAPVFPKQCLLKNKKIDSPDTVGDMKAQFAANPMNRTLDYGKTPSWINLDAYPDHDDRVNGSLVPSFDAYWFLNGHLLSDYSDSRGLYGEVDGQFGVGGSVLGEPIRIVDVRLHAESNMNDSRDGRNGKIHMDAQLVAYAAGTTWYKFGREEDIEHPNPELIFKQNLLDGTFKLLPGDGLEYRVGIFKVAVNAGVEISTPLALNIDTTGPEATFAPMVRAFISVFGGIDFGVKVGLEGEADLLRVDAPFSAKLKWHNRLNPQECALSADFKASLGMDFTTLNGKLTLVAGISDSLIPGMLYREELVNWTGIHLYSAQIDLLDMAYPKVLKYPAVLCQLGHQACAETVAADWTFSDFESSHFGFKVVDAANYGTLACPNQYVMEVPVAGFTGNGVWVQPQWHPEDVTTPAACNESYLRMDSWVQKNGTSWEQQPAFEVSGKWYEGVGCVQSVDTGSNLLPPDESQWPGSPWAWFAKTSDVTKMRFALTSEVVCAKQRVEIRVDDNR